ncbi:MAG: peptide transporter substrate-binding protein [Actinomycetia bacterium]|nr:peptide transporter substrate-binding protein [Actinomycetes bacterium]
MALVAVAGCTGSGGGDGSGASGGSGGGGAGSGGRSGGTLAIALLDPGPLDPARADGLEDEIVLGNLFDGLTALDPSGAVRPAMAASWTSDPALRRWEFRLRPEARWSDGAPVRSDDFTFAWQRLADPEARPGPSPARALLSGVSGYRAFAAGRARSIAGLETPDPATLVVQLDRPFADLPALVASLPLSPLPAALVRPDPAAYLAKPVGNGPFRLAAPARPGRPLTVDRNPAFWGAAALLDRVRVSRAPDEQTAWLELQNGQAAFAPVPPDQLPAARTVYGPSADGRTSPGLLQGPTLTTWQLTFNLRSKPGGDPRWRRAVSLAIDRDRLAEEVAGTAATSLVPPATPGWTSGTGPACPACAHDPAEARALLAKAKPESAPVALTVPAGAEARRIATLVADDLDTAGIEVEVSSSPARDGGSPLTLARRVASYPHPDPYLTAASTTSTARRLLDQARATADTPARTARYHQAEAALLADLAAAPLVTDRHAAVLTSAPQGVDLTPWGALDLAVVSLPA